VGSRGKRVPRQAALLREIQIAVGHRALNFARTTHRIDDAGEFCQHAVAGGLDDAAVMLADLRIHQLDEVRLQAFVRAFLIGAHQARIAHLIGGEDRSETTGGGVAIARAAITSRAEFNLLRTGARQFHATGRSGFARNKWILTTETRVDMCTQIAHIIMCSNGMNQSG